jgi:hypothetical protein
MLTQSHQQEALSRAYVQAIAARAGMTFSLPSNDYGIDLTLNEIEVRGARWGESGHKLDVQAKSTTKAHVRKTGIKYNMEVQAYEDLRVLQTGCPRILVLLVLPQDERKWCEQTEDKLVLRRCAYWLSLRGLPRTSNRKTVQVAIPKTQVFSAAALRAMMKRIKAGGVP